MQEREYAPREARAEDDAASDQEEEQRSDAVEQARRRAAKIEPGVPGYCDMCGEHFERVVARTFRYEPVYACGRCRDRLKLG
jgi:RNA polymerase-binding transcription factor DksA